MSDEAKPTGLRVEKDGRVFAVPGFQAAADETQPTTGTRAEVVADSVNPKGVRLVSVQCSFPTVILPQVRTYATLAYSVQSMRAVPTARLIEATRADPYVPREWRTAQKGMTAGGLLPAEVAAVCQGAWQDSLDAALTSARVLAANGAAKEEANRLLSPFSYSLAIITGTGDAWEWFLSQRTADDAQPAMKELARSIQGVMLASKPAPLAAGQWHLPYVRGGWATQMEEAMTNADARLISAARCARVSYGRPKEMSYGDELTRGRRLIGDGHWGPFEHQALACNHSRPVGKHVGWLSHRAYVGH